MKKKKNHLHRLMKESIYDMISQQGPSQDEAPITDISLDEKVDHFLIMGERESTAISQQFAKENKNTFLKSLMHNIFEADDPKPDAPDDSPMPDAGAGGGIDLTGSDPMASSGGGDVQKGPPAVPTPKINIGTFSKNVARLVNDYQTLIDPKRIILNRAKAYIEKNYNPEMAKQFMEILDTEYNLSPDSISDKEYPMPISAGALDSIDNSSGGSS